VSRTVADHVQSLLDHRVVRTLCGLLLAPIAGAQLVAIAWAVFTFGQLQLATGWNADALASLPIGVLYVTVFTLPVAIIVGIPTALSLGLVAHLLLWRSNLVGVIPYLGAGAAIGAIAIGIVRGADLTTPQLVAVSLAAAASGWMFWLIRRPDRDAPTRPQK
jgi:hypothetical protein